MNQPRFIHTLLVISLFTLAGCGGESISPVYGKVTIKGGGPAVGTTVVFTNSARHISASGSCGADGTYELTYQQVGDGAPPGSYSITFSPPGSIDGTTPPPPQPFNSRYLEASTSNLTREVKSGKNTIDFELDPP